MSLLLCILLLVHDSGLAASVPLVGNSTQMPLPTTDGSITSVPPQFGQRSTWDIFWGCLITLLTCSWVAVHPPIYGQIPWYTSFLRRAELMLTTLIRPQLTIRCAVREWMGARELSRCYKDKRWTKTHGYFIQMDGFVLFDGAEAEGIVTPERLEELLSQKAIAFPAVTEDEIKDRSKGDWLSKGLVLIQVTWFIVQIVARSLNGLSVAQLEQVTVGYAVLNGFMYLFWWNKPLNVQLPIPIYLLNSTNSPGRAVKSSGISCRSISFDGTSESDHRIKDNISQNTDLSVEMPLKRRNPSDQINGIGSANGVPATIIVDENVETEADVPMKNLTEPLGHSGGGPNPVDEFLSEIDTTSRKIVDYLAPGRPKRKKPFDVAYDVEGGKLSAYIVSNVLSAFIGVIHCMGWNLSFPSALEVTLWRISSAILLGYPVTVLLFILPLLVVRRCLRPRKVRYSVISPRKVTTFHNISVFVLSFFYELGFVANSIAGVFGFVLSIRALGHLPLSATYTVQWTRYIPHL